MFISQFLVLHDVKNDFFFPHDTAQSIGQCLPGCPFSAVGGPCPRVPSALLCVEALGFLFFSCSSSIPHMKLSSTQAGLLGSWGKARV